MQCWQYSQHLWIIFSEQDVRPLFDNVMKSEMDSNI